MICPCYALLALSDFSMESWPNLLMCPVSQPIQRVCKYPLLFAELLKHTPVFDCPHSHMVIEDALVRLREATGEINRATDDPQMKTTLERTWLLQDRLVFPDQVCAARSRMRSTFGRC